MIPPHPPSGHLLPQGEKGFCEIEPHRLLPLWENVGEARMRGKSPRTLGPHFGFATAFALRGSLDEPLPWG